MNILDLYDRDSWEYFVNYINRRMGLCRFESEDVFQEVVLQLYNKYGDADIPKEDIIAFIKKCLRYKTCEKFKYYERQHNNKENYTERTTLGKPNEQIVIEEKLTGNRPFTSALTTLEKESLEVLIRLIEDRRQKAVMRDFYVRDLSRSAIAKKRKTTENAVRSILQRGRKSIQNSLHKLLPLVKLIERRDLI